MALVRYFKTPITPVNTGTAARGTSNFPAAEDHDHGIAGGGDVTGPAGATNGNLAVFDGGTGKIIKDGGAPGSGSTASMGRTFLFMGA